MEQIITAGLIGSLITIIIQAIINAIGDRVKYKRELRSLIFKRKTEIVEKAMSWYQEALDMYSMFQMALREYDMDCNPVTIEKIQASCIKSNKLFTETESRLNLIYLYYDFSDIEDKYHGRKSIQIINETIALIGKIGYDIETLEPSEFSEQLSTALHEQRVQASHTLAEAINNQIYIIVEIQNLLRKEYKNFLQ